MNTLARDISSRYQETVLLGKDGTPALLEEKFISLDTKGLHTTDTTTLLVFIPQFSCTHREFWSGLNSVVGVSLIFSHL